MKQSAIKRVVPSLIFLILLLFSISFLYPVFFMINNSLKSSTAYLKSPFSLASGNLAWDNYATMISQFQIFDLFKNSFLISVFTIIFLLIIGIVASYAFAKLKFKGHNIVFILTISTMFIPAQVTMIPLYMLFSKIHLVDTYWSVILSYLGIFLPEVILLLTATFRGIPDEIIEAAKVDGAGYFNMLRYIIVPMGRAGIMLCIIFYFIVTWNDLFIPMVFLQNMKLRTVMVALSALASRYRGDPTFQFAGLVLAAIPAILVYAFFQQYIIKGLSAGAIK